MISQFFKGTKFTSGKILLDGSYLLASLISLILPALYYGFPLLHEDTKTYVYSGFSNFIPYDRPIGYGWFLRYASLNFSFWVVVIFQSIILFFLIWVLCKYVFAFQSPIKAASLSTILVSVISYASLYTSMLLPDIFSAYIVLGIWILILGNKLPKHIYGIIFLIIIYSLFSHFSNIALVTLLTILLVLYAFIKREVKLYKLLAFLVGSIIISLVLLKITNKAVDGTEKVSKGKNIILMARLVEIGIIPDYLEEYDTDSSYSLTKSIDRLREIKSAAGFVWDTKSPLFDGDCVEVSYKNCWKEKNDEYGRLMKEVFLTPKYFIKFAAIFIKDSFIQFFTINAKAHFYQNPDESIISSIIKKYLPNDYRIYSKAVQMKTYINSGPVNNVYKYTFLLSLLGFVIVIIKRKKYPIYFQSAIIVLVALYSNALVCATLSNVVGRYQGRVVWLIPLLLILFILQLERDKNSLPERN